MSLSGRVGLITGGGTGIGFAISKAFAANGAKVYITGRRLEVLEESAASLTGVPGSIVPLQMDVTDEDAVKQGAKRMKELMESWIFFAGIAGSLRDPDFITKKYSASDPFEPETVQDWVDIFTLNTIAPFFVVRAFQPLLVKGAQSRPQGTSNVINISSSAVGLHTLGPFTSVAYGATKAALEKLTFVLATSFAARDIQIRVNAISPGVFASQLTSPEFLEELKTKPMSGFVAPIPAKRHGTDAEMGMAAVYLAASDYTNGVILSVDGGVSLVNP
ncbi:NAD(P)-binding protein [Armillaria solidipes]|uniref:NAD(P)-binding protein n=1 Tax=Armillaria solidipes TaxID=1076256 RepID=A0A2H3BAU5_9AGAR|nr:NAD(P)-binding protein [Armillaria solidipes]